MPQYVTVCQLEEVPEGEARAFVVNDLPIAIFHVDGQFFALENKCPHAGASLAHGSIEGDAVRCRVHHLRFRICDGVYLDEAKPQWNARVLPLRLCGREIQVAVSAGTQP